MEEGEKKINKEPYAINLLLEEKGSGRVVPFGSGSLLLLINRSTHLASLFNYMFMAFLICIEYIVNLKEHFIWLDRSYMI